MPHTLHHCADSNLRHPQAIDEVNKKLSSSLFRRVIGSKVVMTVEPFDGEYWLAEVRGRLARPAMCLSVIFLQPDHTFCAVLILVPAMQDYHQQYLEKGGQNASKGAWLVDGRLYHPAEYRFPAWRVCTVPLRVPHCVVRACMAAVFPSPSSDADQVGCCMCAGATDRIRCYG